MALLTDENSHLGTIASSVVLLLIIYNITSAIYSVYFHPLSKFPGPPLLAASPLFSWFQFATGRETKTQLELTKKYGPIVRVAPNALLFTGSQAWRDITGFTQGKKQLKKDPGLFGRKQRDAYSIINTPDDADHGRQRRHLAHAFSDAALREQEPLIKPYFDLLIAQLNKQVDGPNKGRVDIVQWYNFTTFDVIGDLAFGDPFNALAEGVYHPWIAAIFRGVKASRFIQLTLIYPALRYLLQAIFFCIPAIERGLRKHSRYTEEKVDRRLATETDRKDFMSYVLRDKERPLSNAELKNNMQLIILAGSETTATLLSGLTYLILKNPRVYHKLRNEVINKFSSDEEITFLTTSQLPYLSAVIEESFRLYPPVPQRVPRVTGPEGNTIDGHYVPPNTSVAVMQYAAGLSADNWHNPEEFFPERWTEEAPPEYVAKDDKNSLQPFSTGPRNCIGKNLAYNEMKAIVARVLWNFDLELQQESKDWIKQSAYFLWEKHPLWVKLSHRDGR